MPRTKIILEPVDHGPGSWPTVKIYSERQLDSLVRKITSTRSARQPRTKIHSTQPAEPRSVTRKARELPVIMESQVGLEDPLVVETKIMTETGYTESRPPKGGFGHGGSTGHRS